MVHSWTIKTCKKLPIINNSNIAKFDHVICSRQLCLLVCMYCIFSLMCLTLEKRRNERGPRLAVALFFKCFRFRIARLSSHKANRGRLVKCSMFLSVKLDSPGNSYIQYQFLMVIFISGCI
jgi:hypothetical protein